MRVGVRGRRRVGMGVRVKIIARVMDEDEGDDEGDDEDESH